MHCDSAKEEDMTRSTRKILFGVLLTASTMASATDDALLGPMANDLRGRVGRWCVEAHLQLTPEARPVVINAVAENRLIGGRWLVTEMRGPGFEGVGLNGFDPQTGRYSGYWVDGSRGFTVPVEGEYDAAGRVFRTRSTERRADGASVIILSETRTDGPDGQATTFIAPDAHGRSYQRMLLLQRRARDGEDCLTPSRM
jgi:hypothetical protein